MSGKRTPLERGNEDLKVEDVVSGDEGRNMIVILGGGRDIFPGVQMMMLKKQNRSYQNSGLKDDVPFDTHMSGTKGWMDPDSFTEWLGERRIVNPLPYNCTNVLDVHKYSAKKLA